MLIKNIIISTDVCHADNDDEYCNSNALLRFLITNNYISDLHGFNFKTIIIIAEYLKIPHLTLSCPEVLPWAMDKRCRSVPY